MQAKTADSNVMEPILNPGDVTILPNENTDVSNQSQIYAENAVTGKLQLSDLLHEEGDVIFCAAIVTLTEVTVNVHTNNFTDQPYKLNKRLLQSDDSRANEITSNQETQCLLGIY